MGREGDNLCINQTGDGISFPLILLSRAITDNSELGLCPIIGRVSHQLLQLEIVEDGSLPCELCDPASLLITFDKERVEGL